RGMKGKSGGSSFIGFLSGWALAVQGMGLSARELLDAENSLSEVEHGVGPWSDGRVEPQYSAIRAASRSGRKRVCTTIRRGRWWGNALQKACQKARVMVGALAYGSV